MSAITSMPGRRAASQKANERRKVLILGVLAVVLVVLLAFELPKLLKSSSSSAGTASTAASTTATAVGAIPAPAGVSSAVAVKRLRVIRHMSAKDPFVPLVRESTASPSASTAPSAHAQRAGAATGGKRVVMTPVPTTAGAHTAAAPTAAVIWTNGHRQVVGLSQVFSVGDAKFHLVAITRKAMRIKLVGGLFAGGKHAIEVRKGRPFTLANTATGVRYRLLFTKRTTATPTVTVNAAPQGTLAASSSAQPSGTTASAPPSTQTSASGG